MLHQCQVVLHAAPVSSCGVACCTSVKLWCCMLHQCQVVVLHAVPVSSCGAACCTSVTLCCMLYQCQVVVHAAPVSHCGACCTSVKLWCMLHQCHIVVHAAPVSSCGAACCTSVKLWCCVLHQCQVVVLHAAPVSSCGAACYPFHVRSWRCTKGTWADSSPGLLISVIPANRQPTLSSSLDTAWLLFLLIAFVWRCSLLSSRLVALLLHVI